MEKLRTTREYNSLHLYKETKSPFRQLLTTYTFFIAQIVYLLKNVFQGWRERKQCPPFVRNIYMLKINRNAIVCLFQDITRLTYQRARLISFARP